MWPNVRRIQSRVDEVLTRAGSSWDWVLVALAALIGILAGLVATAFDGLVRLSELFFFGRIAQHEFSGWKILLLIPLPALGGLAVGMINHYISRSPPGHGIPEVMEALARRRGVIPFRVGLFKMVTASLTIGSGGSAGQEGPIVQIGAVVSSQVGQFLKVTRTQMNTLVGCGAAAGLAALFNAPIAGVLFVLEIMLRDFSLRTFMPIVVASVLGVATMRTVHGTVLDLAGLAPLHAQESIFRVSAALQQHPFQFKEIMAYAVLGVLCGVVGYIFIRSHYAMESLARRSQLHPAFKPAFGGLVLGALGVVFVLSFGRDVGGYEPPVFFANGYPVIQWLLDPATYLPSAAGAGGPVRQATVLMLLAALVCKLLGTGLTLGWGGSGGTFAPSLFMGATLGGAFGLLVQQVPGFGNISPANYALVGMAGVLAGAVHCPLTAFILAFEITNDYKIILPVMLVAVTATTIAKIGQRESIYTRALRERGVRVGALSDLTVLRRLDVASVPLAPAVTLAPGESAQRLVELAQQSDSADFVVCDRDGRYLGMVVGDDLRTALLEREALPLMIVAEVMRTDLPSVARNEVLESALDKFARYDTSSLAVADGDGKVIGTITRARLMRQYLKTLEEE